MNFLLFCNIKSIRCRHLYTLYGSLVVSVLFIYLFFFFFCMYVCKRTFICMQIFMFKELFPLKQLFHITLSMKQMSDYTVHKTN